MTTYYVGSQFQVTGDTLVDWAGIPTTYSYQWQQSPDGLTSWSNTVGETRSDTIPAVGLTGMWIRCGVTATNSGGSSTIAYSNAVGPLSTFVPPPPPSSGPDTIYAEYKVDLPWYWNNGTVVLTYRNP